MLPRSGEARVLYVDSSEERLGRFIERVRSEGLAVICTRSAADGLSIVAKSRPSIVVLDSDFLTVDSEHIPEYINRINPTTSVFLTVDEPRDWKSAPQFVQTVVGRDDLDALVSLIRRSH